MYRNRLDRSRKGLPDRSYTDLVTFYNSALEHMKSTLKVNIYFMIYGLID